MSRVDFKLNRAGVRELLRSGEMASICREHANKVKNAAGDGYEVTTYTGRNRVNASVHAETDEARKDNYENNTVLKALGGG